MHFQKRLECPTCAEKQNIEELYCAPFLDSPIQEYLESFYISQGKVELEYLKSETFCLNQCGNCQLIFQSNLPNNDLLLRVYEIWIDPKYVYENIASKQPPSYFRKIRRQIQSIPKLTGLPPSETRVLDYSMGWGQWCEQAQKLGFTVEGTEYSPSRIAHAKKIGISVISEENLEASRYHFINAEQVFEHLSKPSETLEKLQRSLTKGGILRIAVPNGKNMKQLLKYPNWLAPKGHPQNLGPIAPLEHLNCFNHECLMTFGESKGLKWLQTSPTYTNLAILRFANARVLRKLISMLFSLATESPWYAFPDNGTELLFIKS